MPTGCFLQRWGGLYFYAREDSLFLAAERTAEGKGRATGQPTMPDKFDPYREALIIETNTIWPEQYEELDPQKKKKSQPRCTPIRKTLRTWFYVRMHSGFCREITITDEDIARVKGK